MKKLFTIFLILLLNLGCAQIQRPMVNDEFTPYVKDFELIVNNKQYDYKLQNLTILFEDIPSTGDGYQTVAYCSMMFTDKPSIYVDRKQYQYATPMSRQFTLLHELGHCVCNRFHTENSVGVVGFFENILFKLGLVTKKGFLKDGCPASIMHPYAFSESCMMTHYFYYIDEYKRGCN